MATRKALTEIKEIAAHHMYRYPSNSPEGKAWARVHELADDGDARTLSDDPTVAKRKAAAKKERRQ